jgi:hypothetical protein
MTPDDLAAIAMREAGGDRRKAVRALVDAAIVLVLGGSPADQRWGGELLINRACDADSDLENVFGEADETVQH